jgi:hypothetical protein
MSHIYRYVLCLLLFVAGIANVNAQQYPVTASTQIIPPYSVYLPDYAVPGSDKLRVILVQNDLTVPSYNVRLQMTVEQNGTVIMRTAAMFNPKPLSLSPGIPTIIGGIDLADYLNPANIDYSGGFSRNEYEKTRSLPEGAYRVSFTAYDYSRPQVQVSNIGSNVFFFRKSDPPLLNLPICNSRVEKLDPQFLTFNWSSRNSPNPLPGSGTEYVFSLYEVRPAGSNPDYIVRSVRPIYTLVTETNTIVYGPGEPQLRDSMQYVWVVQARDKSGRDMFSNQGLSQSCTFTYLGKNPFTQNNVPKPVLKGRATGERSMRLSWELAAANYQVEAYRLQYRAAKVGDTEFDWQTEEKQTDTAFTANSLEPNREYEGRLQWKIAGVYGPFSDVVKIKTDSTKTFVCGDAGLLAALDNKNPLASLSVGKIIRVGNFDIILTEVSGGNGKFTGKGRVITLGFGIGLQMEFKDITVNTDMKVIAGQVTAVTEGIDKYVSDKLDEQHGGNDVGGVQTGDIVPDITTKLKIFTPANIKVNTDDGTITLTDSNTGQQEVVNYKDKGKTLPLVLEDADGNLYNIDKGGKVTSVGKRDSSITSAVLESLKTLSLDKGTVTFTPGTGNVYAFDAWKSSYAGKTAVEKEYESLASGKYHVSSKAIVPDEQEQVIATLTNAASGISASKLKFITGKGIVLTAKDNGNNSFSINLTGGPGGDAQEIYAAHPDGNGGYVSLGKLLLVSYKPLQKTLVLVPIGTQTTVPAEQIKTALEKTYKKLGITYTVQVDESFRYNKTWDRNGDSVLQDKGSAFLSNDFTGEEKALKKAYKKATKIDDNSVYLFVVNEAALSDGDLAGKMPRGSQFGFVFTKQATEATIVRTVVHEIGHGDYTLEHTFSTNVGLEKGSTDNLMDYGSGYGLIKYQWDVLHDPGSVWGIFEDDAAGDNYTAKFIVKDFINADSTTVSFLTPAGTILVVPFNDLGSVEFQYGAIKVKDKTDRFDPEITVGAVKSFRLANSERLLRTYEYVVADGTYKDPEGNVYQQNVADPAKVEGFIYPISCINKYKLMKFSRRTLPFYKGGEPKLTFTQMTELFTPFKDQDQMPMRRISPITNASEEIEQEVTAGMTLGCLYCITDVTVAMTEKHCRQDEHIWIDKLAQMRNVYPEYFNRFTQTKIFKSGSSGATSWDKDGSWEAPETINGYVASGTPGPAGPTGKNIIVHDYDYPWGQYLIDHPDIKAAYGKDDILFFKTFFTQFIEYVNTVIVSDEEFWEKFNRSTPVKDVFVQLREDPIFHLQSIPVEKRGLALKMMTENFNNQEIILLGGKEPSYLRLLSSFIADRQAAAMLKYIEDSIKVRKIFDLFVTGDKPELYQVGVLTALSNMITGSGHYNYSEDVLGDLLVSPELVAEVEADLFQFKNADITFSADNKLFINSRLYDYNDYVSVKVAGSFEMNGQMIAKGQLLQMPAIQVALMASVAKMRQTEKQVSLAFDVGLMVIGVGEARIFLSAGKYIQKAILVADMVGSATDVTMQLINYDALGEKWRTTLQIATFALSLPSMVKSVPKVEKYIEDLDELLDLRRKANALGKEIGELERIGEGLCDVAGIPDYIADGQELVERAVSMDKEADILTVKNRLKARGDVDNNIYIVIHGKGSTFNIIHNGEDLEMNHRSLAIWIKKQGFPADKQLVLLSCANIETAQDVARKAKVSLVANDGVVKVYDNGVIEAENGFKYIDKNGNIDESRKVVIGEQKPPGGGMIRLGKEGPRTASVEEIIEDFGVTSEVAQKLADDVDFAAAYVASATIGQPGTKLMRALEGMAGEAEKMANARKTMLAAFANNPGLFNQFYTQMIEAENIARSAEKILITGKSARGAAEKLATIRSTVTRLFKDRMKVEVPYFLNGIFNRAVTNHLPLGKKEMDLIDEARRIANIDPKRNVLVVQFYLKGNPNPIQIIAGSAENSIQKGLNVDKVLGDVPDGVSNFDQFQVGTLPRIQDSESKFAEWYLSTGKMQMPPDQIERIVYISERPVCPSCVNVLGMLNGKEKFMNTVIYEGKYLR